MGLTEVFSHLAFSNSLLFNQLSKTDKQLFAYLNPSPSFIYYCTAVSPGLSVKCFYLSCHCPPYQNNSTLNCPIQVKNFFAKRVLIMYLFNKVRMCGMCMLFFPVGFPTPRGFLHDLFGHSRSSLLFLTNLTTSPCRHH